jgi:hypothetical protein
MHSRSLLILTNVLAVGALVLLAPSAPASAASALTFVSRTGTDSGTCASPANPCRTFAFAFGVTSAGGEIKALNPGEYGGVLINKSITITGVEGASINKPSGYGIYVNAGASDVVNVSNLIFDGAKATNYGLLLKTVGSLTVTNCVFRNFANAGIFMQPNTGTTTFRIADVVASDNAAYGIHFVAASSAVTNGVLERVKLHHNGGMGFYADRTSNSATLNVVINGSAATNNTGNGFESAAQGTFILRNSIATGNGTGLFVNTQAASTGDNLFYGNSTNTAGFFSTVSPQ